MFWRAFSAFHVKVVFLFTKTKFSFAGSSTGGAAVHGNCSCRKLAVKFNHPHNRCPAPSANASSSMDFYLLQNTALSTTSKRVLNALQPRYRWFSVRTYSSILAVLLGKSAQKPTLRVVANCLYKVDRSVIKKNRKGSALAMHMTQGEPPLSPFTF